MSISKKEMDLYYGGNSHACVTKMYPASSPSVEELMSPEQFCGQIVPPNDLVKRLLNYSDTVSYACVRSDDLKITCGVAKKLYTPELISKDTLVVIAVLGAAAAFFIYQKWSNRHVADKA